MEARRAALILMKNSHFDRTPQYAEIEANILFLCNSVDVKSWFERPWQTMLIYMETQFRYNSAGNRFVAFFFDVELPVYIFTVLNLCIPRKSAILSCFDGCLATSEYSLLVKTWPGF